MDVRSHEGGITLGSVHVTTDPLSQQCTRNCQSGGLGDPGWSRRKRHKAVSPTSHQITRKLSQREPPKNIVFGGWKTMKNGSWKSRFYVKSIKQHPIKQCNITAEYGWSLSILVSPLWALLTTLFQTAPALDVRCLSNFIASDFEFDDVLGVPKRKVNF